MIKFPLLSRHSAQLLFLYPKQVVGDLQPILGLQSRPGQLYLRLETSRRVLLLNLCGRSIGSQTFSPMDIAAA